jgi:uncharacterized oxidoreductase
MLSIYIKPEKYVNQNDYEKEIKRYIKFFKSAKPIEEGNEILMPGEKEVINQKDRLKNGIPLSKITWQAIINTAKSLKIDEKIINKCL